VLVDDVNLKLAASEFDITQNEVTKLSAKNNLAVVSRRLLAKTSAP
jgi:hypothetical protein